MPIVKIKNRETIIKLLLLKYSIEDKNIHRLKKIKEWLKFILVILFFKYSFNKNQLWHF